MTTTRALVSGRIIKHGGHALVVMRGAHATSHATSALGNRSVGTLGAMDCAADRLIAHSANDDGEHDYTVDGRLL